MAASSLCLLSPHAVSTNKEIKEVNPASFSKLAAPKWTLLDSLPI